MEYKITTVYEIEIFYWHNPSGRTMALGSIQLLIELSKSKGKGLPQQADLAQGFRLRPRIFLTFGTTSMVGRQPYAPAAFTPGEIPGTHF